MPPCEGLLSPRQSKLCPGSKLRAFQSQFKSNLAPAGREGRLVGTVRPQMPQKAAARAILGPRTAELLTPNIAAQQPRGSSTKRPILLFSQDDRDLRLLSRRVQFSEVKKPFNGIQVAVFQDGLNGF